MTTPKQTSSNERSVISNAVSLMGHPTSNTQSSNQSGVNQSQTLGSIGANSHAINSPANKLTLGSTTGNQIPTDAPFNPYGVSTNSSSISGENQATNNTAHEVSAPSASQTVTSTWSKFAQQSGPSQAIESTKTSDSFQQFKKQAKEKMDKEKLIEMQEQRRREREQQEREQQEKERLTQEQRIDQEGEMALNSLARSEQSPVLSPASDSQSPASGAASGSSSNNMLKLREQERRKREALASQNQMDLSRQSEIMSKFEDRV